RAPDALNQLQTAFEEFSATTPGAESQTRLQELYRKLHAFSGVAGLAGLKRLGELCSSLETLIVELHEQPASDLPSPRRTIGRAIQFLREKFSALAALPEAATEHPVRILVVD